MRAINRFDRTPAAGPDGLYSSILQTLLKYSEGEDPIYNPSVELTKFIQNFLDGKLPPDAAAHLSGAQITARRKPDESIRPIACGTAYRRLASRLAMQSISSDSELHSYLEPHQISVGSAGGLEAGIHAPRHTIGSSQEYVLLSIDFSNACNRCSRQASSTLVKYIHPPLARYIHYTYVTPALLHTRQQSFLSQEGTQQGDSLGMLLFSSVAQPLVLYIQATFRPLLNLRMPDDGNVVALIDVAQKIYKYIKSEGPPQDLHMKVTKTKVWWPTTSSDLLQKFDCNVLCNRDETAAEGITLLGAAFGCPSHIRSHFSKFRFEN